MKRRVKSRDAEFNRRVGPKRKFKDQLPHPRSARLSVELDARVTIYLRDNNLAFNQLCQFAIEQFISTPQTLNLREAPTLQKKEHNPYSS